MNCKTGGFIAIRHNEIRDLSADLLSDVCKDVKVEPVLEPLTGEHFEEKSIAKEEEARVDISARGFWSRGQTAFCDVRVFSPLAKSYVSRNLAGVYRSQEKEKKRKYNLRIQHVDRGTFTPLVFSCFGGMGLETARFYHRLAHLISDRRKVEVCQVSAWLKAKLNFSLIRTMQLCIRGTRKKKIESDVIESLDDVVYINKIASI